ncbi:SDR family NAD(P)-dependent oxidoreductase [Actinospica robiniae]|uniref:SDR family NAD(P)-dependent oxidoreductase n=1 Tax=Actinospica robiniae TaxID=304901 RepID=UPI000401DF44|nr:SDR family NAD(P)-dependent oxidoreductase [Actinospica robiniae]
MSGEAGFGSDSTARDVVRGRDLSRLSVVVTGATSGLGEETARALASAGARVLVTGRSPEAGPRLLAALRVSAGPDAGEIEYDHLDLSSLRSVREFAERRKAAGVPISTLIANAGVMATPLTRTEDGFEMQFGVNHLGHFALTEQLLPLLRAADEARVVVLSSRAHRRGDIDFDDPNYQHREYEPWESYGQSKTANALHAVGLSAHYGDDGITAFSVMPGAIMSGLQRHMPADQLRDWGWADQQGNRLTPPGWKSIEQGAATSVWAALAPELAGRGGSYLDDCAVAQPWTEPGTVPNGYVMPYAIDPERAERLWKLSAELVG